MKIQVLTKTLLFASVVFTLAAKPKFIAEFTKVECENQNTQIVIVLNCHVNRTSKYTSGLYSEFEFSEDLFALSAKYLIQTEHAGRWFNYSSNEVDYCEAFQMVHNQNIVQIIAVQLRRTTNFPIGCPLKKNTRYYIHDFKIDPKAIPSYAPLVSFRSEITFVFNHRKMFTYRTFGKVGRK